MVHQYSRGISASTRLLLGYPCPRHYLHNHDHPRYQPQVFSSEVVDSLILGHNKYLH